MTSPSGLSPHNSHNSFDIEPLSLSKDEHYLDPSKNELTDLSFEPVSSLSSSDPNILHSFRTNSPSITQPSSSPLPATNYQSEDVEVALAAVAAAQASVQMLRGQKDGKQRVLGTDNKIKSTIQKPTVLIASHSASPGPTPTNFASQNKEKFHSYDRKEKEREEKLSNSLQVWETSVYRSFPTAFPSHRDEDDFRQMVRRGELHGRLRGTIWQKGIGNGLNLTSHLWKGLRAQGLEELRAMEENERLHGKTEPDDDPPTAEFKSAALSLFCIQLDLPRTLSHFRNFQRGGPDYESLVSLLMSFALFRPDIGYVQGMSYLGICCLMNLDEMEAFFVFTNLILTSHFLFSLYKGSTAEIERHLVLFDAAVSVSLPEVSARLLSFQIKAGIYGMDWFMTMFVSCLPLECVMVVWDRYAVDGEVALIQAGLAILMYLTPVILTQEYEEIMMALHRPLDPICVSQLADLMDKSDMKPKRWRALLEKLDSCDRRLWNLRDGR
ncbi:putative TBC1 domain family member 12 [Blattamonas nauphoetae]|uniref:TBC1 domain family member 12 n=1 Tax=Blattamonas nauphoetae TaxID=2049346 RepID=A0ABQ9YFP4_9EUKA|nr:putative TBC1 domain family member 12 [Blattamonas nauphoetae]